MRGFSDVGYPEGLVTRRSRGSLATEENHTPHHGQRKMELMDQPRWPRSRSKMQQSRGGPEELTTGRFGESLAEQVTVCWVRLIGIAWMLTGVVAITSEAFPPSEALSLDRGAEEAPAAGGDRGDHSRNAR